MKHASIAFLIVAAAACGGSKKAETLGTSNTAPPAEPTAPEPPTEPEPPPPPPPQVWTAEAALAPVKGAKVKPFTIAFAQTEGEGATATMEALAGLKAGRYHLVVHEGSACGKNATGAGDAWADAGGVIELTAAKGAPAALAGEAVTLNLGGDQAVVGHALVLHDDKKGQPGKALACGVIALTEDDDAGAAADPDAGE